MPRLHRKIWLWSGEWWALQLYINRYLSVGVHVDCQRPLIDIHAGWFILALGRRPEITLDADAQRQSCRGFLIRPVL
jgi:hypothetical protein